MYTSSNGVVLLTYLLFSGLSGEARLKQIAQKAKKGNKIICSMYFQSLCISLTLYAEQPTFKIEKECVNLLHIAKVKKYKLMNLCPAYKFLANSLGIFLHFIRKCLIQSFFIKSG
jgi:hypothetical protein